MWKLMLSAEACSNSVIASLEVYGISKFEQEHCFGWVLRPARSQWQEDMSNILFENRLLLLTAVRRAFNWDRISLYFLECSWGA